MPAQIVYIVTLATTPPIPLSPIAILVRPAPLPLQMARQTAPNVLLAKPSPRMEIRNVTIVLLELSVLVPDPVTVPLVYRALTNPIPGSQRASIVLQSVTIPIQLNAFLALLVVMVTNRLFLNAILVMRELSVIKLLLLIVLCVPWELLKTLLANQLVITALKVPTQIHTDCPIANNVYQEQQVQSKVKFLTFPIISSNYSIQVVLPHVPSAMPASKLQPTVAPLVLNAIQVTFRRIT